MEYVGAGKVDEGVTNRDPARSHIQYLAGCIGSELR